MSIWKTDVNQKEINDRIQHFYFYEKLKQPKKKTLGKLINNINQISTYQPAIHIDN